MERSWLWKAVGIFLLTAISVVYLLPGIAGKERLPAWYTKYIKKELQLGLDLQGGIHLVYEVDVDKAAGDKADRIATDIEQRLDQLLEEKGRKKEDEKGPFKVDPLRGELDIVVTFDRPSDLKLMDDDFMSNYRRNLNEVERDATKGVVRLRMDEEYVKEVQDYALRQGLETIRSRIDKFGVAEPSIRPKGRDIAIELPGLGKDRFERVKKLIGRTAQLEFKMCDDDKEGREFMTRVAAKVPEKGPIEVRTDSYDGKQRGTVVYSYLQSKDRKALREFIGGLEIPKTHEILFGVEQAKDEKGNDLPEKIWRTYYVHRRAPLTGEFITDAEVQWDERTGRPEVGLTFDHQGAELFADLSGENIGERMAIILDEKVNSAPVFQGRIGGGRARITLGGFKDPFALQKEAKDLVAVLRAGALPAPLRKVFETQVGPTLGKDAVRKGILAFSIGGGLVLLFMLYYYRGAGLIADICLILNFLFIAAILTGLEATLTLPGIAGLVLTVGMAVDANVIIYERVREELALGKSPRAAVDAGYSRAFWTIFDAQVTTAIAAFVLWQYGSGPIQGFAVTLLAGIVCSIFTGVVVTRLFFDFVVGKFRPKSLSI